MSGGAEIGGTRSRGPVYGDATVEPIMGASHRRSMRVTGGQIPEGPSSAPRRAPLMGMRPARRSVEQGPRLLGMRPRRRAEARGLKPARTARSRVAPTPKGAGTAPPSAGQDAGPPTPYPLNRAATAEVAA